MGLPAYQMGADTWKMGFVPSFHVVRLTSCHCVNLLQSRKLRNLIVVRQEGILPSLGAPEPEIHGDLFLDLFPPETRFNPAMSSHELNR